VPEQRSAKEPEVVGTANDLRQDFHDFIFIRTTAQGIEQLAQSTWSKSMRIPLRHYRDIQRRAVAITQQEMQLLIRVFSERRIKFSIGLPVTPDLVGQKVLITEQGTFEGQDARVIAVRHTADGIRLTLGIMMFAGTKELKIPDVKPTSIHLDASPDDLIGMEFIHEAETILLDILSRIVNHKETEESRREDASMLNRLFIYSYLTVSAPAAAMRFMALMLICASLRNDADSTTVLTDQVSRLLTAAPPLAPALQALLCLALFIATRQPDYRTMAKQHIRQHPDDCTENLQRLLSLCKRLRSRLPDTH